MATLSAGNLVSLRSQQGRATPYLSIFQPVTLLTCLVNNAGATRGMRTVAFDGGTGSGFATIAEGQTVEVDTAGGTKKTFVKSITGSQVSGTIELYENGILWADNQVIRIKHLYEPHPVPPAIRSGVFYKFYNVSYVAQNSTPAPVAIIGSHRAGFLSAGSITFSLNSTFSYAIASGASISSRVWSCVHNGGAATGISFSSTTAANPTLTITEAGQYWLKCVVTDSNSQTATSYRAIFVYDRGVSDPYKDFTIQSFSGDWQSGGWKVSLQATGDVELSDFPDGGLAVLWYENTFNGVSGFVNLWLVSDEILTCGYLRQDNDNDNFDKGTGQVTFQITTIDDLLNNIAELGSVSLNAVTTPAVWYEYASWMTTGRSVHHLLLWQAWGVFQCADVYGLTANALGVKTTDYTESSLLQQVNGFAYNRGIFAKLICDRLGRLHLVADSQMLSDAARAALDTVFTLSEADISGVVDVARAPEETTTFTQLDGFSFDGSTSTPFISIIPGYRESDISYIMPEERGGSTAAVSNQVLADQTDSNVRAGRYHALQNNNPRELRFSNPYNGLGAFDIVPSIGWYVWGIADADLKRNTELNGRKMVCRHIDVRFNHPAGTIFTDVVLEPEAEGPPGIQGNYPTGYPASPALPTPDWDDSGAGGGTTSDFIVANANGTAANGEATVGQLIAGVPTFGTHYEFQSGAVAEIAIGALSATKAIVCYSSAGLGRAKVLDIAGTVITPATVATFNGASTTWISCAALSATQAIVTYRDSDTHGKAIILDISGSTITPGSEVEFAGVAIVSTCVTRLSATKAVVSYVDQVTGLATTCVLDVSGSTITANTPQGLTSGDADFTGICSLNSNTAIMAYRDDSTQALCVAALTGITTSGTFGSIVVLDNVNDSFDNNPGMPFIRKIDSSRAIIAYQADLSPFLIRAIVVSHSGGVVTPGTGIALSNAGYDEYPTVVMPNTATAVVLFDRSAAGQTDGLYSTATISGLAATYNNDQTIWEADSVEVLASAELKAVS